MKRFKITLILFAALLVITSCDKDFEEINQDPNNPTTVPSHLLIPTVVTEVQGSMNSTFVGGDMGACWAQQFAKVQYNDEARYIPRLGSIGGTWTNVYSDAISNAVAMYNLAEEEGNNNMMGVALVLQAHSYGLLTDLFGDIPYSEAMSTGDGIFAPAYDSQQAVYNGVLELCTKAMALLGTGGDINSTSDIVYHGNAASWKKFAASLKFRSLMRISGKTNVSADLQALVNSGQLFSSIDEEAKLVYLTATADANPLYQTVVDGTRGEWKVNSEIVDRMLATNDPRLPQYAQLNDGGIYRGKPSGYADVPNNDYNYTNVSAIGEFYLRPEAPGYFVSYPELLFLMAEAAHKGYISGDAEMYFKNGIAASFEANEVADNGYIDALTLQSGENGLMQIGTELWKAIYAQGLEAWTEQRRTGYPVLSPAAEGAINEIPSRYVYPTVEASINGENYDAAVASQGADELTTSIWWMN